MTHQKMLADETRSIGQWVHVCNDAIWYEIYKSYKILTAW